MNDILRTIMKNIIIAAYAMAAAPMVSADIRGPKTIPYKVYSGPRHESHYKAFSIVCSSQPTQRCKGMESHLYAEVRREEGALPTVYMTIPIEVTSCENNAFARLITDAGCLIVYNQKGYPYEDVHNGMQLYGDCLFCNDINNFSSIAMESVKESIVNVKTNGIEMVPGEHVLNITLETRVGLVNVNKGDSTGAGYYVHGNFLGGGGAATSITATTEPMPLSSTFLIWKDGQRF
ncbi:hypothetical protein H8467_003207 [Salmonella enterica]|nr:hypothetical protein [Salmonella enterica]